jgi:2-polyprenyl-3-methyl-5-hydroxy-6-metoxy-1,4-benzoquinol methylase
MTHTTHQTEIESGERFAFGDNWANFLKVLNDSRINEAVKSLKEMLEVEDLNGKTFLDIGSGSGLFSLAAKMLGAKVLSFDYDPQSVACTNELKHRYFPNDSDWTVETGSALDQEYLKRLGSFDIVYSWGVLHHTGNMWLALEIASSNVADNGKLFLALYNHQPFASSYWKFVKRTYNKYSFTRPFFLVVHALYPTLPSIVLNLIQRRKYPRGMNAWYDLKDWLGGYPFEVSKPEQIFEFFKLKGYNLSKIKTVGVGLDVMSTSLGKCPMVTLDGLCRCLP